jgi:hypothetical protein
VVNFLPVASKDKSEKRDNPNSKHPADIARTVFVFSKLICSPAHNWGYRGYDLEESTSYGRGALIPGAESPGVKILYCGASGPQYETYIMAPFWHIEFYGGSYIFRKYVDPQVL